MTAKRAKAPSHRDDRGAWIDAGMTDADTGYLQRSGFAAAWRTPAELHRSGTNLRWHPGVPYKTVRPPADLFDLFVNLASATDERVIEFARTYGVIYLCDTHDGRPLGHRREVGAPDDEPAPCDILGKDNPYIPIAYYREFAKSCRAALNIAKNLCDDVSGSYEDWVVLDPDHARVPYQTRSTDSAWHFVDVVRADPALKDHHRLVETDRERLAELLDEWLDTAEVRFRVTWPAGPTPQFHVRVGTLFGALVISLIMTINGTGIAACSVCGRLYTPKRRPAPNRRNYCEEPDCIKARGAYAKQRSRAKSNQRPAQL